MSLKQGIVRPVGAQDMPWSFAIKAVEKKILEQFNTSVAGGFLWACYLARSGADISRKNEAGETPLEIVRRVDEEAVGVLQFFHVQERDVQSGKCKNCFEAAANMVFKPCGHCFYCEDCSQRMRRCLTCGMLISGRVPTGIPARLGQRVVRGADWKWDDDDGGDGHVGTVIVVEHTLGDDEASSFCVWVLWDGGHLSKYRASRSGACDLRLYDSGPVGIAFPMVTCDICNKKGIIGTRWKCSVCVDIDLCHLCYMGDRHELDHAFLRIDAPGARGVRVPPRRGSTKVQVRGIFKGAKVVRGEHWEWENEDGGKGQVGTVSSIKDWGKSTARSKARVRWPTTSKNDNRVGFDGYVDLKCTEPALGERFYKDHMPLIAPADACRSQVGKSGFRVGEPVYVTLAADYFEMLQQGHGGWETSMAEIINKKGTVQKDTLFGDVCVSFGATRRWRINPAALTREYDRRSPRTFRWLYYVVAEHAVYLSPDGFALV
ncbi:E3 ubiquitin-protein ligase MIB2-like [Haemaphysalis longicornis]